MTTITRKRTPLGPRQKATYLKPYREAVDAAKAKVAAQEAAAKESEKRLARLNTPAIIIRASEPRQPALVSTLELDTWGLRVGTPAEVRASRKALLEGAAGVNINGGSPKLPSLVRRFRRLAKSDMKRLAALDRRLSRVVAERKALIESAFERGEPYTVERLAEVILAIKKAKAARPSYIDTWVVNRAENALTEAQKHDGTATCPCGPCSNARQMAANEKAYAKRREAEVKLEARRLRKLGQVTFTCPVERDGCGHITEHAQVDVDYDDPDGPTKFVECDGCNQAWALADVTTQPVPGQQQLVA